ncbi:MAG: NAD(P)-dependent oxidoreductase [Polyangiaceae bacterium]
MMIAFFGMGLLGSNFVRAGIRRGETLHVWNRTESRARALEADGAKVFADPAEAVRGAERLHLTLSDDAAVDAVLEAARSGFSEGLTIVDHTTTSPTETRARVAKWQERGVAFLHAPVFMGPMNALQSTGVMLASGDPALVERLTPVLEKMTGRFVPLGPEPERAAAFKLFGNLFLMFMTAGVAEMLTLAKALGVKAEEAVTLFNAFNPGATLDWRVKRVMAAEFDKPSWELSMARKDARIMIEEGERHGVPLEMLPAIAAQMDRFIAQGLGHNDWTVIAKDALSPKNPAAG